MGLILSEKNNYQLANLELPFRIFTSFKNIIGVWKERAESECPKESAYAQSVLDSVSHAKEIFEPFEEIEIVEKYKKEIGILLEAAFPKALGENEIKAAAMPFSFYLFNPSKRFAKIIEGAGKDYEFFIRNLNFDLMYIMGCITILNEFYGTEVDSKTPMYLDIPDVNTGIMKHYRCFYNADFTDIQPTEDTIPLTEEDVKELIDHFDNVALWKEKIPPKSYHFEGFGLITMFDVSTDEALSSLKLELLKEDALDRPDTLRVIQEELRTWFSQPDLHLGISAFDLDTKVIKQFGQSWNSTMLGDALEKNIDDCMDPEYLEEMISRNKPIIVSDTSVFIDEFEAQNEAFDFENIKSLIIAPLRYDNETIGFLELSSPNAGKLNSILAPKLNEITPLFTVALKRSLDEYNNRVKAVVQSEFTAIHPSVSWKFLDEAEKIINAKKEGESIEPPHMVFKDVYPLFGQFDIRGSSAARNSAIQTDLIQQLNLAKSVICDAEAVEQSPIYDHLSYRLEYFIHSLEKGIQAGDEVKVLDFLKEEIYPVFRHVETINKDLFAAVENYLAELDPQLNVIYRERKDYEDTVTTINQTISDFIDREQEKAQGMFPHYFEKYKTDGVEFNMYIGQSLMPVENSYNDVHLKNLRLWQLQMTADVVRLADDLLPNLKKPLQVAALILAHNSPLAIKFRMDEKQFDVDGAYNIRYEIIKKRIDKAYIKGSNERLTQPGKISIVYSQENEAAEYAKYLEFLIAKKSLLPGIEYHELDDMQGAAGLKALRVTVALPQAIKKQKRQKQKQVIAELN